MRSYKFTFEITCASEGQADLDKVEEMIDLSMQDLCYDDEFIVALDEGQSVTIQIVPQIGQMGG